jgi:ribosomal protein S18
MNNPESEQELKEEKIGDDLNQEEKIKEDAIKTEFKSSKKNSFKLRKLRRPLVKVVKKNNYFVRNNITYIDYKDTKLLSLFVNKQGQIIPKIFSKLPSNIQRLVSKKIKKARQMKLMPYIVVNQGNF